MKIFFIHFIFTFAIIGVCEYTYSFPQSQFSSEWERVNGPYEGKVLSLIQNNSRVIAGVSQGGIFVSSLCDNNLADWQYVGLSGVAKLEVNSIIEFGNNFFVCTKDPNYPVYKSINGYNWEHAGNDGILNEKPICIKGKFGNLFLGTMSGLFKSTNNGLSWTKSNLSGMFINSFTIIDNKIFAATDKGVYVNEINNNDWKIAYEYGFSKLQNNHILSLNSSEDFVIANVDYQNGDQIFIFDKKTGNSDEFLSSAKTNITCTAIKGNAIYVGSDDGLRMSTNVGIIWDLLIQNKKVNCLNVNEKYVIAGIGNNGILYTSDNLNWKHSNVYSSIITDIEVYKDSIFVASSTGINKSGDNGNSWQTSLSDLTVSHLITTSNTKLVASSANGIFYYDGVKWRKSQDLNSKPTYSLSTFNGYVVTGTFAHPTDATDKGGVYISSNDGVNWIKYGSGNSLDRTNIYSILMISNTFVIAGLGEIGSRGINYGLWKTLDGGKNWARDGIDNRGIYFLYKCPINNMIFAGTINQGIYYWNNDESIWKPFGKLLESAQILSITHHKDKIFVGTTNGVYQNSIDGEFKDWNELNFGFYEVNYKYPNVYALKVYHDYLFAGTSDYSLWRLPLK